MIAFVVGPCEICGTLMNPPKHDWEWVQYGVCSETCGRKKVAKIKSAQQAGAVDASPRAEKSDKLSGLRN